MEKLNQLSVKLDVRRFARFAVVGGLGTLVDFTALIVLKQVFGVPTLIANTMSYSLGIINNFLLNRAWTFKEARDKSAAVQFVQFAAVSLVGLGLNDLIVGGLERLYVHYLIGKLMATGIVLVWNFFANRYWTFRDAEQLGNDVGTDNIKE